MLIIKILMVRIFILTIRISEVVIRLGLEPKTPTLKVLCSTN